MSAIETPQRENPKPGAEGSVRRRVRRIPVRMDMTPMVDIAFLLLIFFMVTTVFRQPLAMEVNLPERDAKVTVPESNVMTIFISPGDRMFFRIGTEPLAPIAWDELGPTFEANALQNPNLIILVKIDRGARYENMVDMMDTLEDAHMERFSLVAMSDADKTELEAVE